jgi:hypothetical protein
LRLHRYLATAALLPTAGTLLLIAGIYACVDFVEMGSLSAVPAGRLVLSYPLKLPTVAAHVLPLALLLGVLLALSGLRRGGEWEALRSAGLSPLRLGLGLLVVPLAGAVLALPVVEWLGPTALQRFDAGAGLDRSAADTESVWTVDREGTLVRRDGTGRCAKLEIERDSEGRATAFSVDSFAWRRGAGWGSAEQVVECGRQGAADLALASLDRSDGLAGASLPRAELGLAIERLERSGRDATPLRAQGAGRATRLVALGLAVGAAYWLALATAWNGAVLGAWSELWISLGVPALFAVVAAGAALRAARGEGTRTPTR